MDQDERRRMARLLMVVSRFKEIAQRNLADALDLYADKQAIDQFERISKRIWMDTTPRIGWSFFMSVSVHTLGGFPGPQPIVAFYNPVSDIFLVTAWRMDEEIPRMIDAEMLMADWMRTDSPSLSLVPAWLRTEAFKPAALGSGVGQAILACERLFPPRSTVSWRDRLTILGSRQLLDEVNYPAVSLMLYNSLKNIDRFRTATRSDEPLLAACRAKTVEAIRLAARGRIETLLASAHQTLPEMRTRLGRLRPEWFNGLEAVAVLTGNDGCLVILSPVSNVTAALSLFFEIRRDGLAVARMDLVDYRGFYLNAGSLGMAETKGGVQ